MLPTFNPLRKLGLVTSGTIIDPRTNPYIAYWDLVTTIALVFTALVTPFEVAFLKPPLPEERLTDTLFWLNRTIDIIFIIDMALQFRIAYKTEENEGTRWVIESTAVARHYLCSYWFLLDFFSVATSTFDLMGEGMGSLKVLRAVRTLRLMKLIKLARGSRIFKRWEMRISINYSYMTLMSISTVIFLTCHWIACIWGLQAMFNPLNSWTKQKAYCKPWGDPDQAVAEIMLTNGSCTPGWFCEVGECEGGVCVDGYTCASALDLYVFSLYFSVMTITSVGYGDITATPFNPTEQIVTVVIMLATGMLWGYLIGIFCTMAAPAPAVQAFRDDLSALNSFMVQYGLDSQTRFRLREYMHETIHLKNQEAHKGLIQKLSPAMQGEVSLLVNQRTIGRVWYLQRAEVEVLIHLAAKLKPMVFAPLELCPSGFLYVLQKGMVIYAGKVLHQGRVWGEDVLLDNAELQLNFPALAASYVLVVVLDGPALNSAIREFPRSAVMMDRVRRRWALRRAVVRLAERQCHNDGGNFRGRDSPIYAKDVANRIKQDKAEEARRLAELVAITQSSTSFGGSPSPQAPRPSFIKQLTSLSSCAVGYGGIGSPSKCHTSETIFQGEASVKQSRKKSTLFSPLKHASSHSVGHLMRGGASQGSGEEAGGGKAGCPRKKRRRPTSAGNQLAAANYGMRLREVQMGVESEQWRKEGSISRADFSGLQGTVDRLQVDVARLSEQNAEVLQLLRVHLGDAAQSSTSRAGVACGRRPSTGATPRSRRDHMPDGSGAGRGADDGSRASRSEGRALIPDASPGVYTA